MKQKRVIEKRILELVAQIQTIDKRKKEVCEHIMAQVRHTIFEWSKILGQREFTEALRNLYVERTRKQHGSNHFAGWSTKREIQSEFEREAGRLLKAKQTYYYDYLWKRFFNIHTLKPSSWSRSVTESITHDLKITPSGPKVVYKNHATSYNGFNRVDRTIRQEITIDILTLDVIKVEDSLRDKDFAHTGAYELSTAFLKKLLRTKRIRTAKRKKK